MNDRHGTARAHAEFSIAGRGVRIALSPRPDTVALWPDVTYRTIDPATDVTGDPQAWLTLPVDEARALYEALAEYFGGTVVDARSLRHDYDHERSRVDTMISALIATSRVAGR